MERPSFKVAQVEGPLDLILTLISKHKLNIYDINISALLEQYLLYMQGMELQNMEIASEFLEMASRLVQIKTVMLLPRHEEEGEALKTELQGQLLEYQACKRAAELLAARNRGSDRFVRAPQEVAFDLAYTRTHPAGELLAAYGMVLGRERRRLPPPASAFTGIVARPMVSVASRIRYILNRLYQQARVGLAALWEPSGSRSELVATFLALLELIKDKRVVLDEQQELRFKE